MAALKGAVVVVSGATGLVGSGVVQHFLTEGATVVAPLRSAASKPKLTSHLTASTAALHTPVADYGTKEGAEALAKFLKEQSLTVDHVVTISGGMLPTADLADVTPELLSSAVANKVFGHLYVFQAVLPFMRKDPDSSFTLITGSLGEVAPFAPGLALTVIGNTAVFGLAKVLETEVRDTPLRVNELRIGAIIRHDSEQENALFPGVPAQPASKVGAVLAGIARGSQKGEVIRLSAEDLEGVAASA